MVILENIDINIDKDILENIDIDIVIDKGISQENYVVCQARPPADAGFLSPSVQAQAQLTQQHQHPGGVVNLL